MKPWAFLLLLVVTPAPDATARGRGAGGSRSVVDMPVGEKRIRESNIHLVLSKLSDEYQVPIGLEVSAADDLLRDSGIDIRVKAGTLRDVLNALVSRCRLYTWELRDGVINVYPRGANRDSVLAAILSVELEPFMLVEGTGRLTFRDDLVNKKGVSRLLKRHGVTVESNGFFIQDMKPLGRGFSLKASGMTVRALLNRVIRDSKTKYWIINRSWGE